jgi:S-adenosylmethionine-diacylgycerolhomoserine-N-methlytransferase
MGFASDLKLLYHMVLRPIRGKDHAARLESFYAGQAEGYDDFRKRLLKGREEMYTAVDLPAGGVWVDLGGGTGSNLEFVGERLGGLGHVYIVDLAGSLLKMAERRIADRGWSNVTTVEADATRYRPPEAPVDLVTFSYSLTMIPDWFAAIENAAAMLKPGGQIGVVDFYVSRKHPDDGFRRHGFVRRNFWRTWFDADNVFPSPDHVPFLHRRFKRLHFTENRAKVPYLPLARVPYYTFVGRKREEESAAES